MADFENHQISLRKDDIGPDFNAVRHSDQLIAWGWNSAVREVGKWNDFLDRRQ